MRAWSRATSAPTITRSWSTSRPCASSCRSSSFHQDEPLSDWTAVPQHFVSRLARETGTIVVQVGEGADELFHGYDGYLDHRRVVVPFQRWVPGAIRGPVGAVAAHATARAGRAVRHGEALYDAGHSRVPYWGGGLCFRGPLKERLLRGDHGDSLRTVERIWDEGGARRAMPISSSA